MQGALEEDLVDGRGVKSSFQFIPLLDADKMIGIEEVQFC